MAMYSYRAKTIDDQVVEGIVDAETEREAQEEIEGKGISIISLEVKNKNIHIEDIFKRHVRRKDLVIFSRQLAVMVTANIPIVQSLEVVTRQTQNPKLKLILEQVTHEVEAGSKLSDALLEHRGAFDSFYVNMVKSGETSGRLDEVLNYLADQQEKEYDLLRKVKGALIYPFVVLLAMGAAGIVTVVYVIPRLVDVFNSMGVAIPFTTRLLLGVSTFTIQYWWLVILVVLIGGAFLRGYYGTTLGRITISSIKFRLPIFGALFKEIYLLQISRSLHTLLLGGINLVEALTITQNVVDDILFKQILMETVQEVKDGNSVALAFSRSKLVPDLFSNMLVIGERTGQLDFVLDKIGDFYAKEIDNSANNLMTLIEPVVMIILGIGVGIMVSAVFLPLYNISQF